MPQPPDPQQSLALALQHLQANRLRDAEQLYRQVLARHPENPDALQYLGIIAHLSGRNDAAIDLIRRAIAQRPAHAETHANLANIFLAAGRLDDAIAAFRQAINLKPNFAGAHNALGMAVGDKGQLNDAIASFQRAIAIRPSYVEALSNLGIALARAQKFDEAAAAHRQAIALAPKSAGPHANLAYVLHQQGRLDAAVAEYRQAIALNPAEPRAHFNLGIALASQNRLDEAIAAYRQSITLDPRSAETHFNLGVACSRNHQIDDAIASYRHALSFRPDYPQALNALGIALAEKGQLDEAIASHRRAIQLQPSNIDAHINLGNALAAAGKLDDAVSTLRHAVALNPNSAEAHFCFATALLLKGDFTAGLPEYQWRLKYQKSHALPPDRIAAEWNGQPLTSATLLLNCEEGFGDVLQFIRYLPLLRQRCPKVVILCRPELHRLLQPITNGIPLIAPGQPLPPFDAHCTPLSLPYLFGTTLQTIPAPIPYLYADPHAAKHWRDRLSAAHSPIADPIANVGLAWSASSARTLRTMKFANLAPLAQVPNVRFISLQKGNPAAEVITPPPGMHLLDFTPDLTDFADTAALIENLDLVITVDTAVAHLAGAMGKPVWTLLHFSPDWRWQLTGETSPWYPSMRLLRQPSWGDWQSVTTRAANLLSQRLPGKNLFR
jgi:tetratricopeptide (TPR) repeat protein